MKQILSILFFLSIVCCSFAQKSDTLLAKAYKNNSLIYLDDFFKNWQSETPSITNEALQKLNDTIQNVYAVFQIYYDPLNIKKMGGSEWGDDIYKNVKYLLTQDNIEYGIVDTLDKELLVQKKISRLTNGDTSKLQTYLKRYNGDIERFRNNFWEWPEAKQYTVINNFRPTFKFTNPETVALTATYNDLLNKFLGNDSYKLGTGNIMSPARSKGESEKRQKFLENSIKIFYGHWGGYWQLNSYPLASQITFDRKMENAVINFRMIYEGGYAYFKKIEGVWTLIEGRRTWIE